MLIYKAFGRVRHLQNVAFSWANSIENQYFIWYHILDVICLLLGATCRQKAWFWEPLDAGWGPKWWPKSPAWRQKPQMYEKPQPLFRQPRTDVFRRSLSERSLAPSWLILDGFLMNFIDVCITLYVTRRHVYNTSCRLPTSPDTSRIDSKHQEHADICRKSQTQTKNEYTKALIDNLQSPKCNQLQQLPIHKVGAGGAVVLAPLGAFGSSNNQC